MKALVVYTATNELPEITQDMLEQFMFKPCGPHETSRIGFSNNPDGVLVSEITGNIVMNVTTQKKVVNKYHLSATIKVKAAMLEVEQGRPANKKELMEFESQAIEKLLPETYPQEPKRHTVLITREGRVFVGATASVADDITSLIRKTIGTLPIIPLCVNVDANERMTAFVANSLSNEITLGDKVFLTTAEGRKVGISAGSVYHSEAQDLIKDGSVVTKLALNYEGIIDFLLKDDFTISGIKFDSGMTDEVEPEDRVGSFIIQMDELVKMFDNLVGEFDGEFVPKVDLVEED